MKSIAQIATTCVACGCCVGTCPRNALSVPHGVRAEVDPAACVACGRCARACPAGTIEITSRG